MQQGLDVHSPVGRSSGEGVRSHIWVPDGHARHISVSVSVSVSGVGLRGRACENTCVCPWLCVLLCAFKCRAVSAFGRVPQLRSSRHLLRAQERRQRECPPQSEGQRSWASTGLCWAAALGCLKAQHTETFCEGPSARQHTSCLCPWWKGRVPSSHLSVHLFDLPVF